MKVVADVTLFLANYLLALCKMAKRQIVVTAIHKELVGIHILALKHNRLTEETQKWLRLATDREIRFQVNFP